MSISTALSHVSPESSWTLRIAGAGDADPPTLVVHGDDLARILAKLMHDERVQDIRVAPRAREVRAQIAPRSGEAS
jgi:hypothetical protein